MVALAQTAAIEQTVDSEKEKDQLDLYEEVKDALADREPAEDRDAVLYEMRHTGLRRKNRQGWQADMHLPVSDSIILKKKPYYFEQLYATEHIASFAARSMDRQARSGALSAARWFDYNVKEETNFEDQCLILIDYMLQSGRTVLKARWDTKRKRIDLRAIDWVKIIVPTGTDLNWTQDNRPLWLVEVIDMSEREYRRTKEYKQEQDGKKEGEKEDFVKSIMGGAPDQQTVSKEDAKRQRAGLTYSADPKRIILWLLWELSEEGDSWTVHTYSPVLGPVKGTVRKPYRSATGPWLPYFDFHKEVKDNDWLSSRGVPEKVGMFERAGSSIWNTKIDCLRFYATPVFTTPHGTPANNSASKRFRPGQVYEDGRTKMDLGQPPFGLDQEVNQQRLVAENLEGVPDMAMGQQGNPQAPRTATEIEKITALFGRNVGMDARIFRRRMREVLKFMWFLYTKHGKENRGFFFQDEWEELDGKLLRDEYKIEPAGGVEAFSKELQYAKAHMLYTLLKDNPYIDRGELTRMLVETFEPALVKRLWRDPKIEQQDQAERQALEIAIMQNGGAVSVKPSDDDPIHIGAIVDFLMRQARNKAPADDELKKQLNIHLLKHLKQLEAKNPKLANELKKKLKAMFTPKKPRRGMTPGPAAEEGELEFNRNGAPA